MKKLASVLILFLAAFALSAQDKSLALTKQSDGSTFYVSEGAVIKATQTTAGSTLLYFDFSGDRKSIGIKERGADTGNVASSVTLTFAYSSGGGSVDSIKINDVEIMNGTVAFTSNLSTTLGLVEDSIDNNTQSPVNYSASNTATTVTISAPAAFGDTANGYTVEVWVTGGITVSSTNPTVMSGGFTVVRSLITLSRNLFNVESGATTLNANRCGAMLPTSSGGTTIRYEGEIRGSVTTTDSQSTVAAAINAL